VSANRLYGRSSQPCLQNCQPSAVTSPAQAAAQSGISRRAYRTTRPLTAIAASTEIARSQTTGTPMRSRSQASE
jgi:hypothetical protein